MSRVIRLTRIHALNWYGYKESIRVEGNLLLAGVTGSGSTIDKDRSGPAQTRGWNRALAAAAPLPPAGPGHVRSTG